MKINILILSIEGREILAVTVGFTTQYGALKQDTSDPRDTETSLTFAKSSSSFINIQQVPFTAT
jgi:hypothetical protein